MNAKLLKKWAFFLMAFLFSLNIVARDTGGLKTIPANRLPVEAQQTLALIKQGGPFPYPKDGVTFGNYEGMLPKQKRGYYHEYTVPTPGAHNRGARRIIAGGKPPQEYYYTDDHYATFKRIDE
ncbi:ribonuclease domain-containing protein [Noviherbaspirillum massiliense]|uniref:ribonuclease domain-containing protein n=1 Tax=Noviherbaspirillum massiliense TaxID=1465823 RepID=UPI0002DF8408|nr:ribonuclease [Noviherbaspirillum massiliense]